MDILVLPDIHGRTFWKEPCRHPEKYEKIVFLGDYFDPYDFEGISVEDAIDNFNEILELKRNNMEKVVLLLGNHDLPYFSTTYYGFSWYHCRHSDEYHDVIARLMDDNREFFQLAYAYRDILFTHAGVEYEWLAMTVQCIDWDVNTICDTLNGLLKTTDGLEKLYCITPSRGGSDRYGSCIWSDVDDMMRSTLRPIEMNPIKELKQVFGHSLQAFYDFNETVSYGEAVEFENCKMIDTAQAYELEGLWHTDQHRHGFSLRAPRVFNTNCHE